MTMTDETMSTECKHEPDWSTVHVEHDGDESYIDVNCKHCGESGCIGSSKTIESEVNWE